MRDDRERSTPPNKRARKQFDANDDVAHFLALALTDASRRGGSPKVSESPNRRTELSDSSPIKSWGKMVSLSFRNFQAVIFFIFILCKLAS